MHRLYRGTPPGCLANFQHGSDNWNALGFTEKEEIRDALNSMQGKRCAYCECQLSSDNQHIEHFWQRSYYPQGTFAWDNLFWSCCQNDSCGKHKDLLPITYDHRDLIKADVDNPEHFFHFMSDGTISIRSGLSAAERERAEETLRIFNLDPHHGRLRAMRRTAAAGYKDTGLAVAHLLEEGAAPTECLEFIMEELNHTANLPFCTAIRHTLLPASMHLSTP